MWASSNLQMPEYPKGQKKNPIYKEAYFSTPYKDELSHKNFADQRVLGSLLSSDT